jgi:hypothetical protein
MLTFGDFPPLKVVLAWTANGFDLFLAQREDPDASPSRPPRFPEETLLLVGRPLTAEERAGDPADAKAIGDDFAASLFLSKAMHRQTNKARFFADAVVRGLAQLAVDPTIEGPQREHLSSVLDAARLVVENLGGPSSGVNPPGAGGESL